MQSEANQQTRQVSQQNWASVKTLVQAGLRLGHFRRGVIDYSNLRRSFLRSNHRMVCNIVHPVGLGVARDILNDALGKLVLDDSIILSQNVRIRCQ